MFHPNETVTIGRYSLTLERKLSKDNDPGVWRCNDPIQGIQTLYIYSAFNRALVEKKRRTAALQQKFAENPNIVHVNHLELNDTTQKLFILADRVSNTLDARLAEGAMREDNVVTVITSILSALVDLHSSNPSITHLGINPSSVMQVKDKWALGHFDSAINFILDPSTEDGNRLAKEIACNTTPGYIAPEIADPLRGYPIGPMTDMWAIGCLLFRMLVGRVPFPVDSVISILKCQYTWPSELRVNEKMKIAVQRCLVENPEERITASELLNYFRQISGHHAISFGVDVCYDILYSIRPNIPDTDISDVELIDDNDETQMQEPIAMSFSVQEPPIHQTEESPVSFTHQSSSDTPPMVMVFGDSKSSPSLDVLEFEEEPPAPAKAIDPMELFDSLVKPAEQNFDYLSAIRNDHESLRKQLLTKSGLELSSAICTIASYGDEGLLFLLYVIHNSGLAGITFLTSINSFPPTLLGEWFQRRKAFSNEYPQYAGNFSVREYTRVHGQIPQPPSPPICIAALMKMLKLLDGLLIILRTTKVRILLDHAIALDKIIAYSIAKFIQFGENVENVQSTLVPRYKNQCEELNRELTKLKLPVLPNEPFDFGNKAVLGSIRMPPDLTMPRKTL